MSVPHLEDLFLSNFQWIRCSGCEDEIRFPAGDHSTRPLHAFSQQMPPLNPESNLAVILLSAGDCHSVPAEEPSSPWGQHFVSAGQLCSFCGFYCIFHFRYI